MREGCQFPGCTPLTAYGKGCRCERCLLGRRDHDRRYYAANRERVLARIKKHTETNREVVSARAKRYRDASPGLRARQHRNGYVAYVNATPPITTGRYSPAEDAVIRSWRGRDVDLAIALGRTYGSIIRRKAWLRRTSETPA